MPEPRAQPPRGVWECRFFFSAEDSGFSPAKVLGELAGAVSAPPGGTIVDRDHYLPGPRTINVKVRERTSSLKVKTLAREERDGFELWQTDADIPLPATRDAWAGAIALTDAAPIADERELLDSLAAATTPGRSAAALERGLPSGSVIEVVKRRTTIDVGNARLETAAVSFGDWSGGSMSFESADLAAARALRARLDTGRWGSPTNYVDILRAARVR